MWSTRIFNYFLLTYLLLQKVAVRADSAPGKPPPIAPQKNIASAEAERDRPIKFTFIYNRQLFCESKKNCAVYQ